MSVILLNKDNFKTLLKEAPVSGDKAALDVAKAQGGLEKAKERLAKLQITDIPGLDSIYTLDQLSIEPFKFNFLLQVVDSDIEGLSLPKPYPFETLARVVEQKPLTLEIKTDEGVLFKMMFTKEEELITQLPGTKKPIVGKSNRVIALVSETGGGKKGKFYNIEFDNAKEVIEQAKGEEENNKQKEGEEGEKEVGKEEGEKKPNYYNGKDLKEVNIKLSDVQDKAKFFTVIKQYKDDPDFQKIFLDAIISTTKSIKINQKPLLVTLKDLRNNGLLEAPESMSGLKRKFLKIKLNLQNFMVEVFSLFAKVAKSGKQSRTFEVIKKFYRELFLIATKGKTSISDEQTRKQLWRKLLGTFSNFLSTLSKLPEMTKGSKKPDEGQKEVKVKNTPKATMSTMESFINQIANSVVLIKEEDEDVGDPTKIKNLNGKIYVSSIELGPKAAARAGEERESYTKKVAQSQQGQTNWDGNLNTLPKAEGGKIPAAVNVKKLVIDLDDSSLTAEQQTVFNQIKGLLGKSNFEGETTIRRSAKDKNTVIIGFPTLGGKKAIVCKVLNNETNLKKYIEVEVAPKIAGKDDFTKSTKAKIQLR